jgi:uncharacterized membrane protein
MPLRQSFLAANHDLSRLPDRMHPMKTDAQRQQDVMAELDWEPAVHAAQIGVEGICASR